MKRFKINRWILIGVLILLLIVSSTSCYLKAHIATPKQITGINGVIALAAGENHIIAIKTDGSLWTWGRNNTGQLGDGTRTDSHIPKQIITSGVTAIAAGTNFSLALKNDGSLWAWGMNGWGQLGDGTSGTYNHSLTPKQIISSGVTAIAAGDQHTLAIKTDGSLWAWGWNEEGQIGDGTPDEFLAEITTPKQIIASGVTAIAGHNHTLAIKTGGSLWGWGLNDWGQLDEAINGDHFTPKQINGISGVSTIAAGNHHTIALKTNGSLWAWGANTASGQLGDGNSGDNFAHPTPKQIISSGVTAIAVGGNHNMILKIDSSLWAWGYNQDGQLGNGTTTNRYTPEQIIASGVTAIATGSNFSLAVKSDGSVWGWGWNRFGQLGK